MERELLSRFFSGEATVEEERQVLDWIDADPAHRLEMLRERRVFDAMLMHAREQRAVRSLSAMLPAWTGQMLRYAAVVALVLVATGTYVVRLNGKLLAATNTISVPAGQRVDVTLPDGTKVCMNALSELKYPTFFAGKERRVQLSGEAFFDVTHDKSHPFVVETYACDVEVLGTRFDVESRAETDELTVSLVEGSVKVIDRVRPDNSLVLCPSQRLAYRDDRFEVDAIPDGENFLWRDGLIAFRDATFEELLRKFEKHYGVKIEVRRAELPATVFTGKIRISEGIDHALWVLRRSADFTCSRNENKDIVYIQ